MSEKIEKIFEDFANQQELKNKKVLVAVSGGVDSMVLLELFQRFGIQIIALHCNFNLRDEAKKDELFFRNEMAKRSIPFEVQVFKNIHKSKGNNSTQMFARNLRRNWFEAVLKKKKFDLIATAHHLDDRIETFFLNLVRGTGIEGLKGMSEKSETYIKPLLAIQKDAIRKFAKKHQILYREDVTNAQNTYKRNLLRNQILPLLKKHFSGFERVMERNMDDFLTVSEIMEQDEKKSFSSIKEPLEQFEKISLNTLDTKNLFFLKRWLLKQNFHPDMVKKICTIDGESETKHFENHKVIIEKKQDSIQIVADSVIEPILIERFENEKVLNIGKSNVLFQKTTKTPNDNFKEMAHSGIFTLDLEKLTFPLTIRGIRSGDRFFPFLGLGKKKVSDILTNMKMSQSEKQKVWILEDASREGVFLSVGKISNHHRVTDETKNILLCKVSYIFTRK